MICAQAAAHCFKLRPAEPQAASTSRITRSPKSRSATARSYPACSLIQNSPEFPKYRPNRSAVSAEMPRCSGLHAHALDRNADCKGLVLR
jgi:hypothetical protein